MKTYKSNRRKKSYTKKIKIYNKFKYRNKKNNTGKKKNTRKNKRFTKKGGVESYFAKYFKDFAESKKREKLRQQIEEELLEKEKYSDKKQHRQNKFNKAFLEDECTICLEDLDDDKGLTQLQKCLQCIDKKDKRIYFTDCEHVFHGRCMDKWLSEDPTCPLCRERVIDNIEEVL